MCTYISYPHIINSGNAMDKSDIHLLDVLRLKSQYEYQWRSLGHAPLQDCLLRELSTVDLETQVDDLFKNSPPQVYFVLLKSTSAFLLWMEENLHQLGWLKPCNRVLTTYQPVISQPSTVVFNTPLGLLV